MGAFILTNAVAPTLGGKLIDAFSLRALGNVDLVVGACAAVSLMLGALLTRRRPGQCVLVMDPALS